jgi:hypothetical protein
MLTPMRLVRNTPLVLGPEAPNHRRHGRVRCDGLRCLFTGFDSIEAAVLDISASGARVCAKRDVGCKAGEVLPVVLVTADARFEVLAKVVWQKRRGFRRFEMGMTFGEPSAELRQRMLGLMRAAHDPHVIYTSRTA